MALISFSEIAAIKQLSTHLEPMATQYIEEAELIDLKPLLGERFYADVVANTPEDLLNGSTYSYDGVDIKHLGLKRVLIEFAYARIIFFGNEVSTPFGLVEKNYQDGANVERNRLKERYKASQQVAFQYWLDVRAYLDRNSSTYPKWNCAEGVGLARFKLKHIR